MPPHQRVYSDTHVVLEHVHSMSMCYPTLAAGVSVASAATDWVLTAAHVEIVPEDTITSDFDIHSLTIEGSDLNGTYELVLYYDEDIDDAQDGPYVECGRLRYSRGGAATQSARLGLITSGPSHSLIPANSRVMAKAAFSDATAQGVATLIISIEYHTY